MPKQDKWVGIADHGGWAVLVTVGADGTMVDRRRVELVEEGLPKIPHHSEGQGLPIEEAVELVERVRASAEKCAGLVLDELSGEVPGKIVGIALRVCPDLPATVAERIQDYRASNVADWVMYRKAMAGAAEARGWRVHWYEAKGVVKGAGERLGKPDAEAHLAGMRKEIGAPWTKDHQMAMAAAIVAAGTKKKAKLLSGGNPQVAKAAGDAPVQEYIAAMPGWKSDVGKRLDALIERSVPNVSKAIRWNSPFYGMEGQGWFLAFHVFTRYVKVAFLRGTLLQPMPPGASKGKETRYLDIYEGDELNEEQLVEWVRQAAELPGVMGPKS